MNVPLPHGSRMDLSIALSKGHQVGNKRALTYLDFRAQSHTRTPPELRLHTL